MIPDISCFFRNRFLLEFLSFLMSSTLQQTILCILTLPD